MNGLEIKMHSVPRIQILQYLHHSISDITECEKVSVFVGVIGKFSCNTFLCEEIFEIPNESLEKVHDFIELRSQLIRGCLPDTHLLGIASLGSGEDLDCSTRKLLVDMTSKILKPCFYLQIGTAHSLMRPSGAILLSDGVCEPLAGVEYICSPSEIVCVDTISVMNCDKSEHVERRLKTISDGFKESLTLGAALPEHFADRLIYSDIFRDSELLKSYIRSLRFEAFENDGTEVTGEIDLLYRCVQSLERLSSEIPIGDAPG